MAELLVAQSQLSQLALTQTAYADTIPLPPSFVMEHDLAIDYWATMYHANADEMRATIKCESNFDPAAVGDHGESVGVAQIHLPAHLDITREQAEDPDWSVQWMAKQWNTNKHIWSCARLLGYTE